VTNTIVVDSSILIRCSSSDSSVRVSASSAENGSSISITCGSRISDRHSDTRCCMPPDNSCGNRRSNPCRPTSSSNWWARSRYAALPRPPLPLSISTGSITFDSTERHGSSAGRWNMNETSGAVR